MSVWLVSRDHSAAVKVSHLPDAVIIFVDTANNTRNIITLTPEQAQKLVSQIRNESRKRT